MLTIRCPYCGARDQTEFAYGGEAHIVRPARPADLNDAEWAEFVFMRTNTKGVLAERWYHAAGCRRWFNALRDTTTDRFLATYPMGEARPNVDDHGSAPSSRPTDGVS